MASLLGGGGGSILLPAQPTPSTPNPILPNRVDADLRMREGTQMR